MLAAAFRPNDAFTVGIAALGTAGMGVDYKNFGGPGAELMSSYMNGRISPAVAYKVNDQFSAGVALNLMYAQMKFAVPTAGGEVQPPSANSFGYGATIGVTYAPTAMVTIGAALETQSYFQDFSFDVGGGQTIKIKLDQPMVGTLGLAVKPAEGLLLALDGQWINWSAVLGKNKPEVSPAGGMAFNMNWSDQFVLKLGAQYQIPALKELTVRAGFNYGKTPVDKASAFESVLFPAIAEQHYTVGVGYDISKWTVNASFMYSPEAKLTGEFPTAGGPAPFSTTMSQTEVQLGAVYKF
jgi:long-chain fatty acid transport protein